MLKGDLRAFFRGYSFVESVCEDPDLTGTCGEVSCGERQTYDRTKSGER